MDAVIDWVNSFDDVNITALEELCSGQLMGKMLVTMVPSFFDDLLEMVDSGDNWALGATNIKKLLRSLAAYYKSVLKKGIDLDEVDANDISKEHDQTALLDLLEVIVGVAVLCENKSHFIQKIFSLEESSQLVLKEMVENVMQRVYDLEEYEEEYEEEEYENSNQAETGSQSNQVNELLITAQEAIAELKQERDKLTQNVEALTSENSNLKLEIERMKEEDFEKDVNREKDRSRADANATAQTHLQQSLEEAQAKLDEALAENEDLKREIYSNMSQVKELKETCALLKEEKLQMTDEIELAREKSLKLTKAEAAIEKYQQKLENMNALKAQNKEMEESVDRYIEQIQNLEATNKSSQSTNKRIETYQNENIELKKEKFENEAALAIKDDEISRLQSELKNITETRNKLENDLASATTQLEIVEGELEESRSQLQGTKGEGEGVFDSPSALKEKIKALELELKHARNNTASGGSDQSSQSDQESLYMVDVLKAELEVCQASKKEREASIIELKRELATVQHELKKATSSNEESATKRNTALEAKHSDSIRSLEEQLALKTSTVQHLEGCLQESETKLNKALQDKEKITIYAKSSVGSFKDKYLAAFQRYKDEKVALEKMYCSSNLFYIFILTLLLVRLQEAREKLEKQQEIHRKEERLMISAVYEV